MYTKNVLKCQATSYIYNILKDLPEPIDTINSGVHHSGDRQHLGLR